MGARRLLRRLFLLVRRDRAEDELAEELELHRELARERLERDGLSAADAERLARRRLGNVALATDDARDEWGWTWLEDIQHDVRFALRLLARERRFAASVVLALGLAIGLNNSVFTVINTALIRDVPFEQPDRLVDLALLDAQGREAGLSTADLRAWSTASTLEGIGASVEGVMNVSEEGRPPARLRGSFLTANTFRLLRSAPIVGRDFMSADDSPGAQPVAIIGYALWQKRYGGDPGVVGRTVRIDLEQTMIVGVMPESFSYPFIAEIWRPLAAFPQLAPDPAARRPFRNIVARLAPGADLGAAQAEIARIAEAAVPTVGGSVPVLRPSLRPMRESIGGRQARSILLTFMGAVVLVLLIACANVANLLLARAMARSREIAVRASLGATRWRIVRQLLIECLILSMLAGALGLLFSFAGARALAVGFSIIEPGVAAGDVMPFWVNLRPDGFVFAFIGAAVLTSTLLFGLVPALQTARVDVNGALKDGDRGAIAGRRARVWTSAFIVAEIALSVMLLVGAGLLWRSFYAHYRTDLIVNPAGLMTARLTTSDKQHEDSDARQRALDELQARLERRFGEGSATIASQAPLLPGGARRRLVVEGAPVPDGGQPLPVSCVYVGRQYFATLGIAPLAGSLADLATPGRSDVAVVDERFAARYVQGANPIGRRVRVTAGDTAEGESSWLTIVAVVRAIPDFSPLPLRHPVIYAPLAAAPSTPRDLSLIVRSAAPVAVAAPLLREEVQQVAPDVPLYGIEEAAAAAARSRSGQRLAGTLFGAVALIGLVLSTLGVYGLTSYGVSQRTREVGVRVALGAQPRQVIWLFLSRTAIHLVLGLILGAAGALAAGRLLQSFLLDVGARDPLTLAGVVAVLSTAAFVACLLPSRRAARLDPMAALRAD
jgi:predicted permease